MNKTITVGRDASNDKQLSYGVVSHRHCEIIIQEDGKFFIRDLGSTNGTYINGRRIGFFRNLVEMSDTSMLD